MAGLLVGDGEDHVEVGDPEVGDPVLGAVDHPFVAVGHCPGQHPAGIGARLGLGQRERRRPLAAGAAGQEALLELVAAVQADRERSQLLHHQDQRRGRTRLGDLLHGHVQHQCAGAGAAVLGLERQPEDVLLGEQGPEIVRILGLLVDLRRPRRDPLLGDLTDRVAEVEMLLRDRVDLGEGGHGVDATGQTERSALRPGYSEPGRSDRGVQSPVGATGVFRARSGDALRNHHSTAGSMSTASRPSHPGRWCRNEDRRRTCTCGRRWPRS